MGTLAGENAGLADAAPRHRRERRPLLLDFEQDIAELPPTGGSYNIFSDPPSDPARR
jgi:hypothetical protein